MQQNKSRLHRKEEMEDERRHELGNKKEGVRMCIVYSSVEDFSLGKIRQSKARSGDCGEVCQKAGNKRSKNKNAADSQLMHPSKLCHGFWCLVICV
jgi:hypothetical protein